MQACSCLPFVSNASASFTLIHPNPHLRSLPTPHPQPHFPLLFTSNFLPSRYSTHLKSAFPLLISTPFSLSLPPFFRIPLSLSSGLSHLLHRPCILLFLQPIASPFLMSLHLHLHSLTSISPPYTIHASLSALDSPTSFSPSLLHIPSLASISEFSPFTLPFMLPLML